MWKKCPVPPLAWASKNARAGRSKAEGKTIHVFPEPKPAVAKGERMNKSELVKTLAEAHNLTQEEAKDMVDTFFDSIKEALEQGDRVEIRGFGSFKIKHYEGYKGRNPKTGEIVDVQPKRLPFFRAGKGLKEHLNK